MHTRITAELTRRFGRWTVVLSFAADLTRSCAPQCARRAAK